MKGCFKFQRVLQVGGFRWGASFLIEDAPQWGASDLIWGGVQKKSLNEDGATPCPPPLWETLILANLLKTEVVNNEHLAVPSAKMI